MTDEAYMREALEEAKQAYAEGEIPIGAVLVHKGKLSLVIIIVESLIRMRQLMPKC